MAVTTLGSLTASAATYPNGSKTFTSTIYSDLTLKGYSSILFRDIKASSDYSGSAINFMASAVTLSGNGNITFNRNSANFDGGAIDNDNILTLTDNGNVTFSANSATEAGGAIYNDGTFTLSDNAAVTFSGNMVSAYGDSDSKGGAIYNFEFSDFTLSGNGDVLFEKNAEVSNGIYRLRSIYSEGLLNLSASEGKIILFKDSVYASSTVNLNQDGTGDIIFTGATTETDLLAVKGTAGTWAEIEASRTSELNGGHPLRRSPDCGGWRDPSREPSGR